MATNRKVLRVAAKKAYKEKFKDSLKRERVPFSAFFKDFLLKHSVSEEESSEKEDFNFEDLVDVNEINNGDTEDK